MCGSSIQVYSGQQQESLICVKENIMKGIEIINHNFSPIFRVSTKIVFTIERMQKAITSLKRIPKELFQRIKKLSFALQTLKNLAQRMAIDCFQNISRAGRVRLSDKVIIDSTDREEHRAKFGFEKLSCFCRFTELPVDIIEGRHFQLRMLPWMAGTSPAMTGLDGIERAVTAGCCRVFSTGFRGVCRAAWRARGRAAALCRAAGSRRR
jgi:hypothetical protein